MQCCACLFEIFEVVIEECFVNLLCFMDVHWLLLYLRALNFGVCAVSSCECVVMYANFVELLDIGIRWL